MAFPWTFSENFDDGTLGNFDSETDASTILDYPAYTELARHGLHPWRGAHAMRARLNGTAVAYVEETSGFDIALEASLNIWFPVLLAENLTIASAGAVILFALQSAGPVNEVVVGVRNNSGVYELFAGETGATRTLPITRNNKKWHEIELAVTISAAGPTTDGTIDFYVDGGQVGAQITGLGQAAIAQAQFGAVSGTSANDAGDILFGGILADDARIYPRHSSRFRETVHVTNDIETVFIGAGTLDAASVTGTGTDAVMTIFDSDIYLSTGIGFSRQPIQYLRNVSANDQSPGFNTPVEFKKGITVQLAGTNPEGYISIKRPSSVVMSPANYVDRGMKRVKEPI